MLTDPENDEKQPAALRVAASMSAQHQNALLAFMLLTLHGAMAWSLNDWWARGLMMAHFGLFLIWQPVWRGEQRIHLVHALAVLGMGTVFAFSGNWWLIAVWIAALFGLIGGSVPATLIRGERLGALIAAVYLVAMLLMWVLPQLVADIAVTNRVENFVRYGMVALPLIILVIPGGQRLRGAPMVVDLIYTVMLFLLAIVLALGSFVILHQQIVHGDGEYLIGVTQALLVMAALMLGLIAG